MFNTPISEDLVQTGVINKLIAIQEKTDDPAFLKSVLGLYLEHTPPLIDKLADALRGRDKTQTQRLAHRIKGSSASVGAARMAALCLTLEKADVMTASDHELEAAVRVMREIFEQTRERLAALA
jgi:HPt (histidine-containing phosphotransfer) domain-containing protein